MLTPKSNGPGGDAFSEVLHRDTDEPLGASRRKPLSQILREEREHKNISLQEVAKLTHIPLNYLQLLEGEEDARVVPDSMYLIASLRGYADFLDVDQGTALTQFIAELDQGPPAGARAGNSARRPRSLKRFSQQWPRALPWTLILLLPLGILAVIGYYSELIQGPRPKDKVVPFPSLSAPPPTSQSEAPPPVSSPVPSASPPVATAPLAEPPAVSAPVVESSGRSLHRLRVQAKAKTWLHVTIDDQPMKRLFLSPGQAVEWSAERGFTLSV